METIRKLLFHIVSQDPKTLPKEVREYITTTILFLLINMQLSTFWILDYILRPQKLVVDFNACLSVYYCRLFLSSQATSNLACRRFTAVYLTVYLQDKIDHFTKYDGDRETKFESIFMIKISIKIVPV